MNDSRISVVCDAGPLIHLDELKSLSLLQDFDQILIPEQVAAEVKRHRPNALTDSNYPFHIVSVAISSKPAFIALVESLALDLGEQAALSLMETYPTEIFLTDDAAARLAADTLGYKVHGTIGIIARAVRRKQRTRAEVVTLLSEIPTKSSLHIRPSLLQSVIDRLQY